MEKDKEINYEKLASDILTIKDSDPTKYKEIMSQLTSANTEKSKKLLGIIGETAARQRRGYEGLQEFAIATTGGVPAIVGTYVPKAIGSMYNGSSMFDPNSPGIVTRGFRENHPYWSLAANIAAGASAAGSLEVMLSNRNGLNSTNWKSPTKTREWNSKTTGNNSSNLQNAERIEIIKRAVQDARDFADDPIVRQAKEADVRVAKRLGHDINPQIGKRSGELHVQTTNGSGQPSWSPSEVYEAGEIRLPWETIAKYGKEELEDVIFHEGIHSQGIGVDKVLLNETSPFAAYKETPTTNWYQFKADRLLESPEKLSKMHNWSTSQLESARRSIEYLRTIGGNGNEFVTNAVTIGKRMGLSPYKTLSTKELNQAVNQFTNTPSSSDGFFLFLKHSINPQTGEIELAYPGYVWKLLTGQYKSGGKIHIKPENRGRLTKLKKRTGKTESELYRDGSPEVRKMITFARNSRKWNKK